MDFSPIRRTNSAPRFEHDCPGCVFLGHALEPGSQKSADVYACSQNGFPTFVFRTDSDGPEYSSYPEVAGYVLVLVNIRDY